MTTQSFQIIDYKNAHVNVGFSFRKYNPGKETEHVDAFIRNLSIKSRKGSSITILREPRLDSGFPDLVVIAWRQHKITGKSNSSALPRLSTLEFRALYLLHAIGEDGVRAAFGKDAAAILRKLCKRGYARENKGYTKPQPLKTFYTIEAIYAIEAKMVNSAKVIEQAMVNTRFATQSAILIPKKGKTPTLSKWARKADIKILDSFSDTIDLTQLPRREAPRSHVALMINEFLIRNCGS